MSKRRFDPDAMSDEEVRDVRRKFFMAVGIGTLAIILVWFGFTTVLPRIMRTVRGEASYAGFPTSHWTEALASKNPTKSYQVAAETLLQGGEKAVPVLTQALKAEDVQTRLLAAKLLAQIRSKNAVAALAVAQKDSDTKVRCWSAYALIVTAPEEGKASIPIVLEATGIHGEGIEEEVDKALPRYPADKRLAGLIESLSSPHIFVRFQAVKHLASMGPEAKDRRARLDRLAERPRGPGSKRQSPGRACRGNLEQDRPGGAGSGGAALLEAAPGPERQPRPAPPTPWAGCAATPSRPSTSS